MYTVYVMYVTKSVTIHSLDQRFFFFNNKRIQLTEVRYLVLLYITTDSQILLAQFTQNN